jgi:heat-inducible transcriptional repressor
MLVHRYDLGVRSATVRNELAEMANLGFLEQPHTSAGRIPSDKGYRYFVDRLIVREPPTLESKQKLRSATEEGDLLQSLLSETTGALSRLTHLLSAATVVRNASLSFKNAILSAIGPHQALLVLVLSNGSVESRVLECPAELTLEQIGMANEELKQSLAGKPLRQVAKAKPVAKGGAPAYEKLMATLWPMIRSVAKEQTRGGVITHGEEYLFGQPEFHREAVHLSSILDELKSTDVLYDALSSPDATGTVTIGKEHRATQLHELSVVKQTFLVGENEAGTIAVIGPTRLPYEKSIPLVSFTAQALTEALTKFFG